MKSYFFLFSDLTIVIQYPESKKEKKIRMSDSKLFMLNNLLAGYP